MRRLPSWSSALPFLLLLVVAIWQILSPYGDAAYAQAPTLSCPTSPSSAAGQNYSGKDLSFMNFRGQDLTNANFSSATLKGTVFIGANLTGADFRNAHILPSDNEDARPTDFTGANLTAACFMGSQFQGRVYFTYSKLTCADFSLTDISGKAIFGPAPLDFDRAACRPAFRASIMNCEFIDDWAFMDLNAPGVERRTNISACLDQLAGRNLANAMLATVNLAGANLDGANLAGADLTHAVLDDASLQCQNPGSSTARCVDLSNAKLQGASLNRANLSGAILYNAFLSNFTGGNVLDAASVTNAHLKNVNLSFAQLSGVDFTSANFYGDNPGPCKTTQANYAGATIGCASAHQATMTETRLTSAYLYGVDFSGASISGASFFQAVLSGAHFAGATLTSSANGNRTSLRAAHLQGTNLDLAAHVVNVDLTDAFVDFKSGGNLMYINLDGASHNRFACPGQCQPPRTQDVCTFVRFPVTTVPQANATITCPDGGLADASGCGAADANGANPRWASSLNIGASVPPAWYRNPGSYAPAAPDTDAICSGRGQQAAITFW